MKMKVLVGYDDSESADGALTDLAHLYPLARLSHQYPRYAALIADTNAARIYVFRIGEKLCEAVVQNQNVNKTQLGGWAQARYQRHIEKLLLATRERDCGCAR